MPFQPMQFPILSFEDNNPLLAGLNYISRLKDQQAKTSQDQTTARYMPSTLAEKLKQLQSKSIEDAATAKYADPMAQASLADLQAKPNLTKAQTAQELAQGKYLDAQTENLPLKSLIDALHVQQSQSRFGPMYQLNRGLSSLGKAGEANWVATNQQPYNKLLSNIANQGISGQGTNAGQANNPLIQQLMTKIYGNAQQGMPQQGIPQQGIPQQGMPQQGIPNTTPDDTSGSSFTTNSANDEQQKITEQMTANQALTRPQVTARAQNAMAIEGYLINPKVRDENSKRIDNAVQYAGLIGRGQKVSDEWLNQHPDAIKDYDWYQNTFSPFVKNGVRYMEAMGATDQQRQELNKMVDVIDNIKSNPDRAKTAINRYLKTMQDVTNGILNVAEPNFKGVYRKQYGIPDYKGNYLSNIVPPLNEWLSSARNANKGISDEELIDYYNNKYGKKK